MSRIDDIETRLKALEESDLGLIALQAQVGQLVTDRNAMVVRLDEMLKRLDLMGEDAGDGTMAVKMVADMHRELDGILRTNLGVSLDVRTVRQTLRLGKKPYVP